MCVQALPRADLGHISSFGCAVLQPYCRMRTAINRWPWPPSKGSLVPVPGWSQARDAVGRDLNALACPQALGSGHGRAPCSLG
jgi:hypothetical protein